MTTSSLPTRSAIVATAGHVDHGKSSLIKALTGIDPDRLPEEKARGITIDLGFAHGAIIGKDFQWNIGFVDVPGHEDFVKNMVAGVGAIQSALLVVAADDGWMPQTEEHLQILEYLGVSKGVVALTKSDLCPSGIEAVIRDVRGRLAGTFLEGATIVPTSIHPPSGLAPLGLALDKALSDAALPKNLGKPRLPIDRMFTVRGVGLVVTGTLQGGEIRKGQVLICQPAGTRYKVRGIQSAHREVECVSLGMRVALQLHAVEVGTRSIGASVLPSRGCVLTWEDAGEITTLLDVELVRSARLENGPAGAKRPLKSGALVRVHVGTRAMAGRVALGGVGPLLPGGRRFARIRLSAPLHAVMGDRFVLRDWSERFTLGGGNILEASPPPRGFHSERRLSFLAELRIAMGDTEAVLRAILRQGSWVTPGMLARRLPCAPVDLNAAIASLSGKGEAVPVGGGLIESAQWNRLLHLAGQRVQEHHRKHPDSPGLALAELLSTMKAELPSENLFEDLVQALAGAGFLRNGSNLRHAGHRPELPKELESAGARIRTALAERPLDPPSRKELAPGPAGVQALKYLIHTSEVVELSGEVVILESAWQSARRTLVEYLRLHGSATTSKLRQLLGTSRRVAIPLLEKLDKEGWTRRQGDLRLIGPKAPKN